LSKKELMNASVTGATASLDATELIVRKILAERDKPRSWAAEVLADRSGIWSGNLLRFASQTEAEAYVNDLALRWFLVQDTRVIPSDDPPNYRWIPGKGMEPIR
jgi:hypothetical protein